MGVRKEIISLCWYYCTIVDGSQGLSFLIFPLWSLEGSGISLCRKQSDGHFRQRWMSWLPTITWSGGFWACVTICWASLHCFLCCCFKNTKGLAESEQEPIQPPRALWLFCNPGMSWRRCLLSMKVQGRALSLSFVSFLLIPYSPLTSAQWNCLCSVLLRAVGGQRNSQVLLRFLCGRRGLMPNGWGAPWVLGRLPPNIYPWSIDCVLVLCPDLLFVWKLVNLRVFRTPLWMRHSSWPWEAYSLVGEKDIHIRNTH